MLPVIALVGRPNVGKSTLFNRLTRSRDALVADQPGLTRDRQYGLGKVGDSSYIVVDTGGISGETEGVDELMAQQVQQAIGEADFVLFLVDAKAGLTLADEKIAQGLRELGKPVAVAVNKTEAIEQDLAGIDFFALALGEPVAIAAAHGQGVKRLINRALAQLPEVKPGDVEAGPEGVKIAVVGRPNVGKSTLINRLLGEERQIAYDQPGTTRDSIFIPFEHQDRHYTLIDTAGVRRRARINEAIEKFSVIKSMQALEAANAALLLLNAHEGVTEQDATLAGHVMDSGCALVVVINKWDGLDQHARDRVKTELQRKLPFLEFAEVHFVSALHGTGVGHLMEAVDNAFAAAMRDIKTSRLTEVLEQAIMAHQPPLVRGRRIKLRYAHQGGKNPPLLIIHGNQAEETPHAYRRYLVNQFRKAFKLYGTPVRLEFKTGDNPYKGKRNVLTARQQRKRKRLVKHVKKGRK
ncbi:MAG: ribosome biogenesis GTPase Der [bacterium]